MEQPELGHVLGALALSAGFSTAQVNNALVATVVISIATSSMLVRLPGRSTYC